MHPQRRRFFGTLLIILFILSEMYLGEAKADFLFEYMSPGQVQSRMVSQDAVICNDHFCTVEMMSGRGISFVEQAVVRPGFRAGVRLSLILLYAAAVLFFFSLFHAAVYTIQSSELYSKTVVLNYIHNQDGKK